MKLVPLKGVEGKGWLITNPSGFKYKTINGDFTAVSDLILYTDDDEETTLNNILLLIIKGDIIV